MDFGLFKGIPSIEAIHLWYFKFIRAVLTVAISNSLNKRKSSNYAQICLVIYAIMCSQLRKKPPLYLIVQAVSGPTPWLEAEAISARNDKAAFITPTISFLNTSNKTVALDHSFRATPFVYKHYKLPRANLRRTNTRQPLIRPSGHERAAAGSFPFWKYNSDQGRVKYSARALSPRRNVTDPK